MESFIVGSSLPSFIITLSYIGNAYRKNKQDINYELLAVFIPAALGIFNVINMKIVEQYGINSSLIVGGIAGLIFSLVGRFKLELPKKIFNIKDEYKVHLMAPVLYALIFRFIITPLTLSIK